MFKLDLEKQRTQRSNCQHLFDHRKSKRIPEGIYFCFIDCAKAFDYVNGNKLWKILKQMGIRDHLICLLQNFILVKKQQLELDVDHWTDSKLGKKYVKTV